MLETFWFVLANFSYALVDIIGFEFILSLIFTVKDGKIKFTFDRGMSKYRKTKVFVFVFILAGLIFFNLSNIFQNNITILFASLGWKTIFLFLMLLSFAVFWITKIILNRRWDFRLVIYSIILFLISFTIFSLSFLPY